MIAKDIQFLKAKEAEVIANMRLQERLAREWAEQQRLQSVQAPPPWADWLMSKKALKASASRLVWNV